MSVILDSRGTPYQAPKRVDRSRYVKHFRRALSAKYDAAQTTDENERHWANADFLSINAANRPQIRKRLRARARYEAQENNSYAKGMILTLANDLIGTGPRLQVQTRDSSANQRIENSFLRWCKEIRLAEKLRTMRLSKAVDGEAFALFTTNQKLIHPIKLDVSPIEADLIDAPLDLVGITSESENDGIRYDNWSNPSSYFIYNEHPGGLTYSSIPYEGEWVDADEVLHIFRCDRPQQRRGVTEIVTALPLFAMLRRFTLATLAAAETAADFAAVMRTTSNATTEAAELGDDEWFDAIPIEYRAMLTLPNGWDITQLKAEHPATTYQMFKREIINEIARCLNMPFNVAAANSSEYNYASGRLDHQVYFKANDVERSQWECTILQRILYAWLDEAVLVPGFLPENVGLIGDWDYRWNWDGFEHVDPQKNANAQKIRLSVGTSNRFIEMAKEGLDTDKEDEKAAESYGMTVKEYRRLLAQSTFGGSLDDSGETESQSEEEAAAEAA